MPEQPHSFTAAGAARIVKAVRQVEKKSVRTRSFTKPTAFGLGGGGSGLPVPTYTGQVLQAVTDNVAAWQFHVSHAIL